MPVIKNQPAFKLDRQQRNLKQPAKHGGIDTAALQQFMQGLGGIAANCAQTAAGAAGGPGAGNLVGQLMGGGLGTGTLGGFGGLGGAGGSTEFNEQLQLLQLQRQVQRQSQIFETMTNIAKAEHDRRMSAVRNMRP